MQQRSLQNTTSRHNTFQLGANLRSLTRSRSDNTFKGAKLGGNIRASSSPLTLPISGSLSKSDRVDIYKFVVQPGARYPTNTYTYKIKGKGVVGTSYIQHPLFTNNQIRPGETMRLIGSNSGSYPGVTSNNSPHPLTLYLKFTPIGKKPVNYSFSTTYYPPVNSMPGPVDDGFGDGFDEGFDDPWFDDL